MVRGARVRIAEFVVGIAAGANDVFLESRRHLICRHDRAHFQAPRIVLERLGGGAGERPRGAGTHGACEHDAAPEQHAAIEQAIAGNRLWRRNLATLANGHGSSPWSLRRRLCGSPAAPTDICCCVEVMLFWSKAALEPTNRTCARLAPFANGLQ